MAEVRSFLTVSLVAATIAALSSGCVASESDASSETTDVPSAMTVTTSVGPVEDVGSSPGAVGITKVIDGDTFDVVIDGKGDTVRLIGINAPERGECFAPEATAALVALLDGGDVQLVADRTDRDRYDRLLRYVWIDDMFVNEELVASGAAIARRYEPDVAEAERLEVAQAEASEAGLGLWASDACGPPATGADNTPSDLRIDHIEADAPGDDSLNLNGEWVRIVNDGAAIDLDGWQLKDESSSHRYDFPPIVLEPDAAITVYSGCGTDTDTDLFWCATRSAIWNNSGDTAFLIDPVGNTATSLGY